MDFGGIAKEIWAQFVTVWNAPIPFLAAMIASWLVMRWHIKGQFETRLANSQSMLTLRDAQLQDYKDKLSGASPDEAKARMDALEQRLDAMGPRKLAAEQRQRMLPFLDPYRGSRVSIAADAGVPDARNLAGSINAAFNAAGWVSSMPMIMGLGNPPPSGVALMVRNPVALTNEERSVADALRAAGLEFDLQGGAQGSQGLLPLHAEIIISNRLEA